jgi:hypothetical protein
MAKAQFHKNQRVYVKPVGTWALIERVVPHWTKGLQEPIRVVYDVGLGREFNAEELQGEMSHAQPTGTDGTDWRIIRLRNKWQSDEETKTHPYPGTYPVVVTGDADWGGWRVPGSEYALSPSSIEYQARLITTAPRLAGILKQLSEWAKQSPSAVPDSLLVLMRECREMVTYIEDAAEK